MSAIKTVIKSFDPTDEKYDEQLEAVRALEALGLAKAEIFVSDIQTSLLTAGEERSNKTVPVTFMVGSRKEVRAFSSSEAGNIGTVVNDNLAPFLNGNKDTIIKGVGNLIGSALNIFLGEGEATSDTIEMYYVATDGLSPVRIDIKAWFQSVTAKSITSKMERIVTVVATKSIIDVNRIDLATFLYLYQGQFDVNNMTQDELTKAIDAAANVYNKFLDYSLRAGTISQQRANVSEEVREIYKESLGKVNKVKDIEMTFTDNRTKE